jgi:uncharacterized protein (TIGR02301 family)
MRAFRTAGRTLAVCMLALALSVTSALAQGRPAPAQGARPAAPAAPPPPPQPLETAPPYERQLLRLSEILGALAWLTELCGDRPGEQWRKQMASLMEAEAASAGRRERLAGAYNRGFRGYGEMHRRCTPGAELIISRFLEEGGRIARDVANRYSG